MEPTVNRTFDRLPSFDERSRGFPIRTLVPATFRSYTWRPNTYLDQGSEGACVGFAWSHELAARPWAILSVTYDTALKVYRMARMVDEWEGEDYDGTSVIAGAKVIASQGYMNEYRWAFGLDDLRRAVGYKGPAVLGLNWYEGMWDTDDRGYVHPSGEVLGGHAILCYSVSELGRYFRLVNSWGTGWGTQGTCKVSFDGMERLLHETGEACIPVIRRWP